MSEQTCPENIPSKNTFWDNATKYTVFAHGDEPFVNEMAYLMVTLHRTGA